MHHPFKMTKILVSYAIPREGLAELFDLYTLIYPDGKCFSDEEILKQLPEIDGIITVFSLTFSKEMIRAAKNLKIISNYGAGYNNIDMESATENGILVTNTPDAVTEPTAELTLGLMIALLRRISELDRKLRTGVTKDWGIMDNLGKTLMGKKLGIVGMGKIGKATARKAHAFGMEIMYYSRQRVKRENEPKVKYVSFNQLLEEADIVTIHLPMTADTHHLFGEEELYRMKRDSFLINTSRGPIVDEKALVSALKNRNIAGAALDVFENEPVIHPELLKLDNVIVVPHIGTAALETRIDIARSAARNIIDFFSGNIPEYTVNPEVLSSS